MGHRDGAARQQQFHCHRAADDVGCADDDGIQAVQVDTGAFQQGHDAFGSARAQQRNALSEATHVIRMEAVHVLVRANALQQQRSVEVRGQGQLQQDAVDGGIFIEAVDQIGQCCLSGISGQVVSLGDKADFLAVLALVRDIDLGGGVAADQNHREARRTQTLLATFGDTFGDLLAQAGGDRLAVD